MPDKKNIESIIKDSGHNFHFEVVKLLRDKGWTVLISPYYTDNITDKSREIDIIAERKYVIQQFYRNRSKPLQFLSIRLFIECKYITNTIVFWFDNKDKKQAIERILQGTPLKPPEENILINNHHYLKNEQAAKLFSKTHDKKDIFYDAMNQCLNAMVYYRNQPAIFPDNCNDNQEVAEVVFYPLVLCSTFDMLYKAEDKSNIIEDYFELEVRYAYKINGKSENEYFLIDVVNFNKFDNFWKGIEESDIRSIKQILGSDEE